MSLLKSTDLKNYSSQSAMIYREVIVILTVTAFAAVICKAPKVPDIPKVDAGKLVGDKVNKTFGEKFKDAANTVKNLAMKAIFQSKKFWSKIPGPIQGLISDRLAELTNMGFDEAHAKMNQEEHNAVAKPIDYIKNILLPMLEIYESVQNKDSFDCMQIKNKIFQYFFFLNILDDEYRQRYADILLHQSEGFKENYLIYQPKEMNYQQMMYGPLLQAFLPYKRNEATFSKDFVKVKKDEFTNFLRNYYGKKTLLV